MTIEPEVHDVPVSYSNCVKIAPKKDTTYTLTATDKKGDNQQAVITMRVFNLSVLATTSCSLSSSVAH